MKIVREALRLFLALTAIILTAMLTNPLGSDSTNTNNLIAQTRTEKKPSDSPAKIIVKREIRLGIFDHANKTSILTAEVADKNFVSKAKAVKSGHSTKKERKLSRSQAIIKAIGESSKHSSKRNWVLNKSRI